MVAIDVNRRVLEDSLGVMVRSNAHILLAKVLHLRVKRDTLELLG